MAQLCMAITMLLSPDAIVISGGLLQRASLFPRIRSEFTRILNGCIERLQWQRELGLQFKKI